MAGVDHQKEDGRHHQKMRAPRPPKTGDGSARSGDGGGKLRQQRTFEVDSKRCGVDESSIGRNDSSDERFSKVDTIREYNESVSSSSASFTATMDRMIFYGGADVGDEDADDWFDADIRVSEATIDLSPEESDSECPSTASSCPSSTDVKPKKLDGYEDFKCRSRSSNGRANNFIARNREELTRKSVETNGRTRRNFALSQSLPSKTSPDQPVVVKRLSNFTLTPSRRIPPIPVSTFCGDDESDEADIKEITLNVDNENHCRRNRNFSTISNRSTKSIENTTTNEEKEDLERLLHAQLTELMEMLSEWQLRSESSGERSSAQIQLQKRLIEKRQHCFHLWRKQQNLVPKPQLGWKSLQQQWCAEKAAAKMEFTGMEKHQSRNNSLSSANNNFANQKVTDCNNNCTSSISPMNPAAAHPPKCDTLSHNSPPSTINLRQLPKSIRQPPAPPPLPESFAKGAAQRREMIQSNSNLSIILVNDNKVPSSRRVDSMEPQECNRIHKASLKSTLADTRSTSGGVVVDTPPSPSSSLSESIDSKRREKSTDFDARHRRANELDRSSGRGDSVDISQTVRQRAMNVSDRHTTSSSPAKSFPAEHCSSFQAHDQHKLASSSSMSQSSHDSKHRFTEQTTKKSIPSNSISQQSTGIDPRDDLMAEIRRVGGAKFLLRKSTA